jgi:hypothetical protein
MSTSSSKGKPESVLTYRLFSLIMISAGFFELLFSTFFASSNLAFLGLGLIFFGAVLGYIRTEGYTQKVLLDSTVLSQVVGSNEIKQKLGYNGWAIYLPPKYFRDPDVQKVYVTKQRDTSLPTPEQVRDPNFLLNDVNGILFTPSGAELARLFERTIEMNFLGADFGYLQRNLPKVFVDLEIARNIVLKNEGSSIKVTIEDCRFVTPFESQLSSEGLSVQDSPIVSAIACALAKATGQPLIITTERVSPNGRNVTIEYYLLDDSVTLINE